MKSETAFLKSIIDSINQIEVYTSVGRDVFMETTVWQDAVVKRLENIGEAVKHLSKSTRNRHPEIPWERVGGMRDRLIHDYLEVDFKIVWGVTQRDLPPLKSAVEDILAWIG